MDRFAHIFADVRRAGRQSARDTLRNTVRIMLADSRELDRVQPYLCEMLPGDRTEHLRILWAECRRIASPPSIYPRVDAVNLRAALIVSRIMEWR